LQVCFCGFIKKRRYRMELYIRIKDASEYLGVKPATLRKYCKEGKVKFYKPDRIMLFKYQDLDHFMQMSAGK